MSISTIDSTKNGRSSQFSVAQVLVKGVLAVLSLLSCGFLTVAQASPVQERFKIVGIAPTVLVDASVEPIPEQLTESTLPKTLSLGWSTEQEIYDLKTMLVDKKWVDKSSCMGWVYMRGKPSDRLVSIHLSSKRGVAKLNSSYREIFSTEIQAFSTIKNPTFDDVKSSKATSGPNGGHVDSGRHWGLVLDIGNTSKKTGHDTTTLSTQDTTCTFLSMRCRRYEYKKNYGSLLWRMPRPQGYTAKDEPQYVEIRRADNKPIEFFFEETCPNIRYGTFSSGDGHRMGSTGDFIDAAMGGFVFNRDPLKALLKDIKK